jgi:SAM-dependent methyltransferase
LVADLEQGLPLAEDSFDQVELCHVLEHLSDLPAFMGQVHRVLRPGGLAHAVVPHYSAAGAYSDPSHRQRLGLFSFDYFCGLATDDFRPLGYRFKLLGRRLIFGRAGRLGLSAWANRHPRAYERHLAWWLPALEVEVWLRALK